MSKMRSCSLVAALCAGLLATVPLGPTADAGGGKAKEAALVELGRRLFFDPVVSRSGSRACAACHQPEHGFSDPDRVSDDDVGRTVRHAQTLVDSHLNPNAHWDGEFPTIEELVTGRIGLLEIGGYGDRNLLKPLTSEHSSVPTRPGEIIGRDETGNVITPVRGTAHGHKEEVDPPVGREIAKPDLDRMPRASEVLDEGGRYRDAFRIAFGGTSVTRARIARAIAAYCRSLEATTSPYDRHVAGEADALTPAQRRGLALFKGKAGCAACHEIGGRRAPLSDYRFHNTGLAWRDHKRRIAEASGRGEAGILMDPGRARLNGVASERRSFKTPTLRDVARRGPFMHSGEFTSLAEVVRYYADGGGKDPDQDKRIRGFEVSDADVSDLVAFLGSLTGDARPGVATSCWHARPKAIRLRFVDGAGKPLPDLAVRLVPVGDALPTTSRRADIARERRTDARGRIEVPPPPRTHYRIVLPGQIEPLHGSLVVDTCRNADVVVPVRGRCSLAVAFPREANAPRALLAEHEGTFVLPGQDIPRTHFLRTGVVRTGDLQVARYDGWLRTDVPPRVKIRVPGRPGNPKPFEVTLSGGEPIKLDTRP